MDSTTVTSLKNATGIEKLALARAREKINTTKWNIGTALFSYGILATVIILKFENVSTQIVATVALAGLGLIWGIGLRRGKQMLQRSYEEELQRLQEFYSRGGTGVQKPPILTRRETEILEYIACGYMNKQVANKLGLSEQTIKNHLSSILRKMDVSHRTEAVVLAIHNGWISSSLLEEAYPKDSKKT